MGDSCHRDWEIGFVGVESEEVETFEGGGFAGGAGAHEGVEDGSAGWGDEAAEVTHQWGRFDGGVVVAAADDAIEADVLAFAVAWSVELGAVGHAGLGGWDCIAAFVAVLL